MVNSFTESLFAKVYAKWGNPIFHRIRGCHHQNDADEEMTLAHAAFKLELQPCFFCYKIRWYIRKSDASNQ